MSSFDEQMGRRATKQGAGTPYEVAHAGCTVSVSHETDNDFTPVGLILAVEYDVVASASEPNLRRADSSSRPAGPLIATRPMRIRLRKELDDDRAAVASGLSVEWRTGDRGFDDAVYVNSPTRDAAVLTAVLNARARDAVRALLAAGFDDIELDDEAGRVRAERGSSAFDSRPDAEALVEQSLDAFAALASSMPPVTHSGGSHPDKPFARATSLLAWVGAVGWSLNLALIVVIIWGVDALGFDPQRAPRVTVFGSLLISIAVGFAGATLYRNVVGAALRGRSNAHRERRGAALAAFGGVSVLAFVAALCLSLMFFAQG